MEEVSCRCGGIFRFVCLSVFRTGRAPLYVLAGHGYAGGASNGFRGIEPEMRRVQGSSSGCNVYPYYEAAGNHRGQKERVGENGYRWFAKFTFRIEPVQQFHRSSPRAGCCRKPFDNDATQAVAEGRTMHRLLNEIPWIPFAGILHTVPASACLFGQVSQRLSCELLQRIQKKADQRGHGHHPR